MEYQQHKILVLICSVLLFTTVLWGCSELTDDKFSSLWDKSFSSCALNCHSPGGTADEGPDLSSKDQFHSNLINKTANDYPDWTRGSDCDDIKFINPGNANTSTVAASLIQSLSDSLIASGSCTATSYNIHLTNSATITDASLQTEITEWINGGAKK